MRILFGKPLPKVVSILVISEGATSSHYNVNTLLRRLQIERPPDLRFIRRRKRLRKKTKKKTKGEN